jgi:hypothetical protein
MVLPSGWLNRQRIKNAQLIEGFVYQVELLPELDRNGYYYSKKQSENFHRYFQLF